MQIADKQNPWLDLAEGFEPKTTVPGMIERIERLMCYWAGREFWTGRGEIVEVGSFAGLSATFFAKGMAENSTTMGKKRRLHCHDLFQMPSFNIEYWCKLLELPLDYRGSFQHIFEKHIAPHAETIAVYPGDILQRGWQGRPIEILFMDCSDSEEIFDHVFRTFGRALIPGQSLIILQDFFYYRSYFLPYFLLNLQEYFELVGTAASSLMVRLLKPLPDEVFHRATVSLENNMRKSLAEVIKLFGGTGTYEGGRLAATFAYLEILSKNPQEALRILKHLADTSKEPQVMGDVAQLTAMLPRQI